MGSQRLKISQDAKQSPAEYPTPRLEFRSYVTSYPSARVVTFTQVFVYMNRLGLLLPQTASASSFFPRGTLMSLSQLARSLKESATLKLNETAALLREKGEPVIHLGGDEPKSKAPIDAVINCTSLLNTGEVRYTAPDGIPALKKTIIRYTEDHYKKIVHAGNVIVSGGAKQSLMVLLHAILDPKEEASIASTGRLTPTPPTNSISAIPSL